MANVREVERKGGRAYEVRWRAGEKFKQRTFMVKREAERFALKVETELAEGNTTDLLVKNGKTVRQVIEASLAASKHELKPGLTTGTSPSTTTASSPSSARARWAPSRGLTYRHGSANCTRPSSRQRPWTTTTWR